MKFPDHFTFISDEVSQDLPVLRAFVKEFGLPGIELRSFAGRAFKDLTREDVAAIGAAAREDGWKIFGCSTPVFKCGLDDATAIAEHREIFKRSLDTARALGADLLRVFTFLRQPDPLEASRLDRVAEHVRGLGEIARGSGVRIGIENEHSCLTGTVEEMEAILARLPADQFGAIWDPCNVLYIPGAAAPVPANVTRLAPRLFHLHVKDSIRRPPTTSGGLLAVGTPLGIGEVDWRGHLGAARAAGYRGMFSLETHWRLKKIDDAMLHLPAGYGFSQGGEAATRICFHNLKVLVETL
ncbi:MAG: sugar phosphate isomerase/epimerase family protein [Opitutaceae bacterium]|nr:sugar phosphate isomerase/epimerase family protein [Opitutaceae bacterium]